MDYRVNTKYRTIASLPKSAESLRWDLPRANQGQIVEIAYADPGQGRHESGEGDLYQRTTDRSTGTVTYARRVGERWIARKVAS